VQKVLKLYEAGAQMRLREERIAEKRAKIIVAEGNFTDVPSPLFLPSTDPDSYSRFWSLYTAL